MRFDFQTWKRNFLRLLLSTSHLRQFVAPGANFVAGLSLYCLRVSWGQQENLDFLVHLIDDDSTSVPQFEECLELIGLHTTPPYSDMQRSVAVWQPERGLAKVVETHGEYWDTMAIVRDDALYCHVEEAVYMVEQGALELRTSERGMSQEEAYCLLATPSYGCSWNAYQVFGQLKKFGYIVGRHGVPWTLQENIGKEESKASVMCGKLELTFDVHKPSSQFQKAKPGEPAFSICFAWDSPPDCSDALALQHANGGVPVKFASAESGHVSYFSFETVALPILM